MIKLKSSMDLVMTFFRFFVTVIFILGCSSHDIFGQSLSKPQETFALVELFTSEGCSSCPPADAFLSQLRELGLTQDTPVYTLGFHVDYWNYLGWEDRFSSQAYTQRQHQYARAMRGTSVYTPQIVVNGVHAMSGNDRQRVLESIKTVLGQRASVVLDVHIEKQTGQFYLSYGVSDLPEGCVLNMALLEDGLTNQIKSGENAGRSLTHDSVVRSFQTVELGKSQGREVIKIPPSLDPARLSLVVFVQNSQNMTILAAHRTIRLID